MSLLIDALRRAEQTRQHATGETPVPIEPSLQLEAQSAPPEPSRETVAAPARPARAQPPAYEPRQAAARQLFASAPMRTPSRTPAILAVIGLLLLVGGALYIWYAMQPHNSMFVGTQQTPHQAPLDTASVRPAQLPPAQASPAPPPPASTSVPVADSRAASPAAPTAVLPPPAPRQTAATETAAQPASGPRIERTTRPQTAVDTPLGRAFSAYAGADVGRAYPLYREALHNDPKNADALNGLATIALRNGATDEAYRLFKEVLVADPKNALARAQLLLLQGEADPLGAESGLRTLLAEQADAPALHFALGSLLARQKRWREAQQSFFSAFTLDSTNPDVMYNLAVSLDHLNQTRLARQYYEQAVSAAAASTASFDLQAATRRAVALATTLATP